MMNLNSDRVQVNRREDKSQRCLLDATKLAALVINALILMLLIGMLIVEITVHQRDEFLRDRDTRDPVERAFAKNGCVTVFVLNACLLIVPLIGLCGICTGSLIFTVCQSFALLISCILAAFYLPYGYVIASLLALGSIVGLAYAKALQLRAARSAQDEIPLA